MRLAGVLKGIVFRMSVCFMLLTAAVSVFSLASGAEAAGMGFAGLVLYILLFSFLLGVGFEVASRLSMNLILKRTLEFLYSYGVFCLVFFVLGGKLGDLYRFVMMSLAFLVVYAVVGGGRILFSSVAGERLKQREYTPVFEEASKKTGGKSGQKTKK